MGDRRVGRGTSSVIIVTVLFVLGACRGEPTTVDAVAEVDGTLTTRNGDSRSTVRPTRPTPSSDDDEPRSPPGSESALEPGAKGDLSDSEAEATDSTGASGVSPEVENDWGESEKDRADDTGSPRTVYDRHAALAADEPVLSLLFPKPDDLGPGWGQLYGSLSDEMMLLDPASEPGGLAPGCEIDGPLVIHDGGYFEMGFGPSPDDAAVLISRGTRQQMESFYDRFIEVVRCTPGPGGEATDITERPDPVLPGVVEVSRFAVDDDAGQHIEFIIIRREELVWVFDVFEPDGAEPVDFDALAGELVGQYHDAFVAQG